MIPDDIKNRDAFFGRRDVDGLLKPRTRAPMKMETGSGVQQEEMDLLKARLASLETTVASLVAELRAGGGVDVKRTGIGTQRRSTSSLGRSGTAKGSLRYQAKVAMVMKKAKDNVEAHHTSHAAQQKQQQVQQTKAKGRLLDRLQNRSRLMQRSRGVKVVPKPKQDVVVEDPN